MSMNTTDLIVLLQELEQDAGGPVPVQVLVRINESRNERYGLSEFDFELVPGVSGDAVLIDLS